MATSERTAKSANGRAAIRMISDNLFSSFLFNRLKSKTEVGDHQQHNKWSDPVPQSWLLNEMEYAHRKETLNQDGYESIQRNRNLAYFDRSACKNPGMKSSYKERPVAICKGTRVHVIWDQIVVHCMAHKPCVQSIQHPARDFWSSLLTKLDILPYPSNLEGWRCLN
jgi:hypothetical protein